MDELKLLQNRFSDLANRAYNKGIWIYSEFLTLYEQNELSKLKLPVKFTLTGGYDEAERKIAVFGDEESFGYESYPPISIVKIEPLNMKFSDDFKHRDFLGSVMALGIKREMTGDIILSENRAYLICIDTMAEYIAGNLDSVKHTHVKCSMCEELPDDVMREPETEEYITASERLDVIIAAVYNLSRNDVLTLFAAQKVFTDNRINENNSFNPPKGTLVSVRGHGRFVYDGVIRTTKKNRNVITVRKYV